ncbi:hypothetical protein [Bosea sp. F3-2]|uniref:hypothetical protein n=1 Tax=Bosea sp. F3-2 TaxID=2599640 RepID=UPI0016557493|nr:hypothetical protein [Bosea sp. F3-2]
MSEPIPFITMAEAARELALTAGYSVGLFVGLSAVAVLLASPPTHICLALWTLH